MAYGNIGRSHHSLGDFKKALEFHELQLGIAKKTGSRVDVAGAYCDLGAAYLFRGDLENSLEYHKRYLSFSKSVGDRRAEGIAYGRLGHTYYSLGNFKKTVEYFQQYHSNSKAVEDRPGEGVAYCELGSAYYALDDFENAQKYHQLHLNIAKATGDKVGEGAAYCNLGSVYHSLGDQCKTEHFYKSSVIVFDKIRDKLRSRDEWKVNIRNKYREVYTALWTIQLEQNKTTEALYTAERGRAQALMDLMESLYGINFNQLGSGYEVGTVSDIASYISSPTVFLAVGKSSINFWVLQKGQDCQFVQKEISNDLQALIDETYKTIGVFKSVMCENRAIDEPANEDIHDQERNEKGCTLSEKESHALKALSDVIITPIAHLIQGDEITIVPDGPLLLVPFAALLDQHSRYLSERLRIRSVPSLTSLKLMAECPEGYHRTTGALLVGDPWVQSVRVRRRKLKQLPSARKEVEMIAKILKIEPLTGERATKCEVLTTLNSVALVHIAAHGCPETGEIVLSPNPSQTKKPKEEEFLLTIADVLNAKLKARLVVLSCCHSGRGKIKAEGVVGLARAFLGAGARCVLVSLWAIDDEATLEFMRNFYEQLLKGQSTSSSLNTAMKQMQRSDTFSDVRYWAPFVLIGDDITLNVGQSR